MRPRRGSPRSPSGVVWSTGLQNPGIDAFVAEELPRLRAGRRARGRLDRRRHPRGVRAAHRASLQGRPEVSALEVYLSGPDEELGRAILGAHVDRAAEIVGRGRAHVDGARVREAADARVGPRRDRARPSCAPARTGLTLGGSAARHAASTPTRSGRRSAAVTGWLSGPAIKPMTLRAVFEVARAVPDVPVIAVGGIRTGDDAVEAMLAGAWAVQVGTATLIDPAAPVDVAQGIVRYLKEKRLASPADVRGRLRVPAGVRRGPATEVDA